MHLLLVGQSIISFVDGVICLKIRKNSELFLKQAPTFLTMVIQKKTVNNLFISLNKSPSYILQHRTHLIFERLKRLLV